MEIKSEIDEIFDRYRKLQKNNSSRCSDLHIEHCANTLCRKGCSECCMNFRVLPVEFFFILNELKKVNYSISKTTDDSDACNFLIDSECAIYEFRPSICRSHGLPILELNSETDDWELTFCPLNFTKVADDYFEEENVYDQHSYNDQLYKLNCEFILQFDQQKFNDETLIPLNDLTHYL